MKIHLKLYKYLMETIIYKQGIYFWNLNYTGCIQKFAHSDMLISHKKIFANICKTQNFEIASLQWKAEKLFEQNLHRLKILRLHHFNGKLKKKVENSQPKVENSQLNLRLRILNLCFFDESQHRFFHPFSIHDHPLDCSKLNPDLSWIISFNGMYCPDQLISGSGAGREHLSAAIFSSFILRKPL